jgi:galactokinase
LPLLSDPPIRLLAKFQELFPSTSPQLILKAPGREMWAAANFNGKSEIAVWSAEIAAHTTFTYQSAKQKQTVQRRPLPHWARYLSGVSVYIDVPEMPGVDVVVGGNEPLGPRYEYALGILFAAFWCDINGQDVSEAELRDLTERVRREYVGA